MKLRTLFTITAVVFAVFGLPSVLAPGTMMSLWGFEVTETASWLPRFQGPPILALAALAWFARSTEESPARRAIVPALTVYWALSSSSGL
jgi:hypothetical protein